MKLQKLLPAVAMTALLFAGCAAGENGSPATPQGQTATNTANQQTGKNTNVQPVQTPEQQAVAEADKAAYVGAKQLNDAGMCNKISNENFKGQCMADVKDQPILDEAVMKLDAKLCEQLSSADRKKSCQIQVETGLKLAEKEKTEQTLLESEYKIRDEAFGKLDVTMCEKITTSGVKTECRTNIITENAQKEKNPALCEELDSVYREQCERAATSR
ncbi:MAG: hypothetical protein U0519_00790 [Candidatus Gracilibacteria bacterium]